MMVTEWIYVYNNAAAWNEGDLQSHFLELRECSKLTMITNSGANNVCH